MATREEIREGIAELYWLEYREGCHYPGYWDKDWATLVKQDNDELGQRYVEVCREFANAIMCREDSQGVVIKVERELPELSDEMIQHDISLYWDKGLVSGDRKSLRGLLSLAEQQLTVEFCSAGYVAVEPLIVEEPIVQPESEQSPKCPKCEGRGFTELEHGLIMVECEDCGGTGEIQDDSRIGQPDTVTGSENSSKPKQRKKRKKKKQASKRSS